MQISLTPELEARIKQKVDSGLYDNASDVVREALRFMEINEALVQEVKLEQLRRALQPGFEDAAAGRFCNMSIEEIVFEARQRKSSNG